MGLLDQRDGGASVGRGSGRSIKTKMAREDTPLLGVGDNATPLSSKSKTFANLFIAIVGAGVLGLPYTFMRAGWVTSLLTLFAVAALTYHGMMLLVRTRRRLEDSSPPLGFTNDDMSKTCQINSFGDLGFAVCGPLGRFAVDAAIVLAQAGFCVGYLIFIGNTLANLFNSEAGTVAAASKLFAPAKIWGISAKSLYIWACFPFQLALNSIPSLTLLAPLSIFADIVDLGAMGVVLVEDAAIIANQSAVSVEAFGSISTFFYAVGVAIYSFEGIGMALPLESEMKDRSKFPKLLFISMLSIALMYGAFGGLGYFAFGENTMDIITSNMGKGLLSTLVQLGLCINLFFTFPLMMNPVYEVFERRFWDGCYCLWLRWLLVLGILLVGCFVPNFTDFLSLVGSSTCCALGLVFPALFHYLVFRDEMSIRRALLDVGVIVLGVFLGVVGTWYAIMEILAVKI